jgi:DNA-binding CsgD family transcriptional regulator
VINVLALRCGAHPSKLGWAYPRGVLISVRDEAVEGVARACYAAGEDLDALRRRLLHALNRVVPFDAAFMAAADPDTLLFTSAFADDALVASGPRFLDNEFGVSRDINRFVDLAYATDPVASLDQVSKGERAASARWREIMAPLGMGDELRVALRVDGTVWGFLCLHRSGPTGFNPSEMAVLRKVAPHAGEAIRRAATFAGDAPADMTAEAVILVAEHTVVAVGGAVDEIETGGPLVVGGQLPLPLAAVVFRLEAIERGDDGLDTPPATIRITTSGGMLVAVHAARLHDATGNGPIVLTIAPAATTERSSFLLAAHGLTPAQRRVANLVLQGRTTSQIVAALGISTHTVQDHLKVVFDKVGVRSRRELVTALMHPTR